MKFRLSLHYNGNNSYLFLYGTKCINSGQKILNIVCFGNISNYFPVGDLKQAGRNGYVHDFSVDYGSTEVDDILDIHIYLMKKNNIICLDLLNKYLLHY